MTPERWRQVEALYHAVVERTPDERDRLLKGAPEGVRREVESLLAQQGSLPVIADSGPTVTQIAPGGQLGAYRIEAMLGEGGMGRVFRAIDTRLGRAVAIKISHQHLDPRFGREARAISSLNHPHICTLFDVGPDYLVMELCEGETLEARLKRGRLSIDETLRLGIQIAGALAAAHAKSVIHRDLKPGNIMLTRAGVKVLDFGLARSSEDETITGSHAVMGTPAYMAPEQRQGRPSDARTDIYSLGLVLHEMTTGKRLEPGMVPDWKDAPVQVAHVMDRCLVLEPEARWQSAADVTVELGWAVKAEELYRPAQSAKLPRWVWALAAFATLMCVIVAAGVWWRWNLPKTNSDAFILQITPPAGAIFAAGSNSSVPVVELSVSPDGSKIAFVAKRNGTAMIWVRSMNAPQAEPLPGTEGGQQPFWSPDGSSIAFFANNSLKKVDATARGRTVTLAEASADPRGGAWLNSGVIIYAPSNLGSLLQVPAGGGQATAVFGDKGGQKWWPSALPDGKHFIFFDRSGGGLFVGSVTGSASQRILATKWAGVYVDPSYLLYLRDGVLMSQGFDANSVKLQGDPVPIAERVGAAATAMPGFSASRSGLVAYSSILLDTTRIIRYDRRGTFVSPLTEPGQYMDPRISPDGRKVAWSRVDPAQLAQDIWVFDSERGNTTRITSDPGIEASPIWSPDGWRLLYRCNRTGLINLFIRDLRTGKDTTIFDHGRQWQVDGGTQNAAPNDWSLDGRYIIYTAPGRTGFDLFQLTPTLDAMPEALARSGFNEMHGAISPDSRRLAFSSDDSGQFEIYLQSFPEGSKQLVSIKGGTEPRWRTDGRELYFLDPAGKVMAVGINAAGEATKPQELFSVRTPAAHAYRQNYHPSPDGQWFVVNTVVDNQAEANITVMINGLALSK